MKKIISSFLIALFVISCSHNKIQVEKKSFQNLPSIGTAIETGPISLGGFSGLQKIGEDTYLTLTDRGPNGPMIDYKKNGKKYRPFLLPSYHPEIVTFTAKDELKVISRISINTTGLPNVPGIDEQPSTPRGTPLVMSPIGIDSEGIYQDEQSNFWIVEEYGPSLLKIAKDGKVLNRFIPQEAPLKRAGKPTLSKVLNKRRDNRGFEGLTYSNGKLYMALQSPINKKSKLIPIIEFDPKTESQTGLYLYELDQNSDKVGDLTTSPDGRLFLLEQNGKTGKECYRRVYSFKIDKRLNLIGTPGEIELTGEKLNKALEYDLFHKILNEEEKVEGISFIDDKTLALIADNDFGLGMLFDEETGKIGKMLNNPSNFYIIKK
ncbi:MAG: esterase-like activity of phytase family protein [Bdellovibrio sp.]